MNPIANPWLRAKTVVPNTTSVLWEKKVNTDQISLKVLLLDTQTPTNLHLHQRANWENTQSKKMLVMEVKRKAKTKALRKSLSPYNLLKKVHKKIKLLSSKRKSPAKRSRHWKWPVRSSPRKRQLFSNNSTQARKKTRVLKPTNNRTVLLLIQIG